LKTKNEAFDAFRKLAKVIQNENGLNIVSLRSDLGGEFQNESFEELFIVQIYVDDIISGATNEILCKKFSSCM